MTQEEADQKFEQALARLIPMHQLFVREYIADPELRQGVAYQRATQCLESTAHPAASRLMRKNPDVAAAVQAGMNARGMRLQIDADRVLTEIAALAFANMADFVEIQEDGSAYVDLKDLTREQAAAIREIIVDEYTEGKGEDARDVKRVQVRLHDKGQNLERLGKHLKLFTDRVEIDNLDEVVEILRAARQRAGNDLAG